MKDFIEELKPFPQAKFEYYQKRMQALKVETVSKEPPGITALEIAVREGKRFLAEVTKLEAELENYRWMTTRNPPTTFHEEPSNCGGVWQISEDVWILNPITKEIRIARYVELGEWVGGWASGFIYWRPIILPPSPERERRVM